MLEDDVNSQQTYGDYYFDFGDCEFTISGAAIGSTSIISSIALVSLFAMLW